MPDLTESVEVCFRVSIAKHVDLCVAGVPPSSGQSDPQFVSNRHSGTPRDGSRGAVCLLACVCLQSENLRPMEMVGLGRQQKCSGAQNSLQQLVKERLRGLVESWMGEVSLDPPEIGSTSQQEEGACEYGWSAALLAHKAVSLTALLAAAALTFLGFWDLRLLLEMVSALSILLVSSILPVCS